MIVQQITHYPPKADVLLSRMSLRLKPLAHKLLEKHACLSWFSQASLHLSYGWQGGPVRQSLYNKLEEQNDW